MDMDDETETEIKRALGTKRLKKTGYRGGGCINDGQGYETDSGLVFIKKNHIPRSKEMFEAEFASLLALEKANFVRVPHPIAIVESRKTVYFVMEFIHMKGSLNKFAAEFGDRLANMHLSAGVERFGFPQTTFIGSLSMVNTWMDDWPAFYAKNRLGVQMDMIQKNYKDAEAYKLWSKLEPLIPRFFENVQVMPSLIHGDLWGGNIEETDKEPIIFDAGCCYAHHEFDLALTTMFGRLPAAFYSAYHAKIPKSIGFSIREDLYHLFHYLNHWNIFGVGYRSKCISIMKKLVAAKFPLNKK